MKAWTDALIRLETIRKSFGVESLPPETITHALRGKSLRTGLIRYALHLKDLDGIPPIVDIAREEVTYHTFQGRIKISQGRSSLRCEEPLDPERPGDIALWAMIGNVTVQDGREVFEFKGTSRSRTRRNMPDRLDRIRVLEGIAVMVKTGMPLNQAYQIMTNAGIPMDPERAYEEMVKFQYGLLLMDRPWVHEAVKKLCPKDAEIPEHVRDAQMLIRDTQDKGVRQGVRSLAKPAELAPEPLAKWERELVEGSGL